MGKVEKINDEYFIEFYARGLKYQQKTGTDKKQAEAALKAIEEQIARGEASLIVRDVDVDLFLKDFLDYAQGLHTLKSIKRFNALREHFWGFLRRERPACTKLSQITPQVVEDYKTYLVRSQDSFGRGLKPNVINLSLVLLREIFAYAIKSGFLNDDPGLHIKFLSSRIRSSLAALSVDKGATLTVRASLASHPDVVPKERRHQFAVYFLQNGVSPGRLYQLLGYDDIAKILIYLPFIPNIDLGMVHKIT